LPFLSDRADWLYHQIVEPELKETMEAPGERGKREIQHGKYLAESGEAERIWNWETPAGRVRAQRRAQLIGAAAGLESGMRVLEIGCGTGLFTELLADFGAHILAIDISPDLIELARKRNVDPSKVEFREMSFEGGKLDEPFDVILGSSVLHHLDILRSIERMYALLKPGGSIVFAEPNMFNPQVWAERHIPFIGMWAHVSPDETAINRFRLRNILDNVGFVDIQISNIDWLHPLTPKPLIPLIAKIGLILERIPVIREFSGSVLIRARKTRSH
jgi:2-polyprenyl-3-methyl-5-hydroxy-6-metoxy-1,4-benzoquinol methylase